MTYTWFTELTFPQIEKACERILGPDSTVQMYRWMYTLVYDIDYYFTKIAFWKQWGPHVITKRYRMPTFKDEVELQTWLLEAMNDFANIQTQEEADTDPTKKEGYIRE